MNDEYDEDCHQDVECRDTMGCRWHGEPVDHVKRDDFQLRYAYGNGVGTLICKKCKGDKFIVGQEEYMTCIKCPTCGWQKSIHEG